MRTAGIDQCEFFFTINRRRQGFIIVSGDQGMHLRRKEVIFYYLHSELYRWIYRVKMSMEMILAGNAVKVSST